MSDALPVDPVALREEVKSRYRAVAVDPQATYHFHTGRPLTRRLGYDQSVVATLPDSAVEAFAGVGNPFSIGRLQPGERVVGRGRQRTQWACTTSSFVRVRSRFCRLRMAGPMS